MKKTLLFVLALIAVGCAEPIPRNLDELVQQGEYPNEVYLDPETLEPYSGPAYRMSEDDSTQIVLRVFYPSGVFRGRATYENGLQEGPYESYYENGEPRNKINYKAGERDGPGESYYENGQLRQKGVWNMGEACGEWIIEGEARTYDPCPPGLEDGN